MAKVINPLPALWTVSSSPIWLFSSLSLQRNLSHQRFPGKMTEQEKIEVCALLASSLQQTQDFKDGFYIEGEHLNPLANDYLYEHFLAPFPMQGAHKGEAVFFDKKGKKLCLMNRMNHLYCHIVDMDEDLFAMWKKFIRLEVKLEKSLNFAFTPRFGYLTADPNRCGAGLEIRVYLQVPALVLSRAIEEYRDLNDPLRLEGLNMGQKGFLGDIVVLKNNRSLGLKEEDLISLVHQMATKLVVQEKSLRERMAQHIDRKVYDAVGRALGLLKFSYSLELHEAFDALGKLRLGLDLGWINGASHKALTAMYFGSQRGHLSLELGNEDVLDVKSLAEVRATYFRKQIQKMTLKDIS